MKRRTANWLRVAIYVPLGIAFAWQLPSLIHGFLPFTPPDANAQVKAMGSLEGLNEAERSFFQNTNGFAPMPAPGPGDWLTSMGKYDRGGQSVKAFKRSRRNDVTEERGTLYVQAWDSALSGETKFLQILQSFVARYYQLPVKLLAPFDGANANITRRDNFGTEQWLTKDILEVMREQVPTDAYCVIALTLTDLYPKESWNFVFGQASLKHRVGVFSLARYGTKDDPDPNHGHAMFLRRACKILAHEIGHMFGARHCIHYHCNLNGSGSLEETDRAPLASCPVCLRKLHLAINFDPTLRYQQLGEFYQQHQLTPEATWIATRLRTMQAQPSKRPIAD